MRDLKATARELEEMLATSLARVLPNARNLMQVRPVGDDAVQVTFEKDALERSLREIAAREAGAHGIKIEDLRVNLNSTGPRALALEVKVRAQKLFFATTVKITGRAAVDENLTLQLSALQCSGEGAIGSLACGFLSPKLQALEKRPVRLAELSLGERRLRDLQVEVGERITLTATC